MKIHTRELTDAALDYAVALALGIDAAVTPALFIKNKLMRAPYPAQRSEYVPHTWRRVPYYSTEWGIGGPLLDRFRISVGPYVKVSEGFHAHRWTEHGCRDTDTCQNGPSNLIAGMRCVVAIHLGHSVEIPDELCADVTAGD